MYEIHIFRGVTSAGEANESGYPVGERHPVLVFSRQLPDTDPDWELAASHVERTGWREVELQEVAKFDPEMIDVEPAGRVA